MKAMQTWLTCTPKSFIGSARFFTRDSGLLSTGFSMLEIKTQAIMLGPEREDDDNRILRATMSELADERFWRSFNAEGVVFYGWGMPRYTPVAQAIKKAGLLLVVHMDTGGILSPRVDGLMFVKLLFHQSWLQRGLVLGTSRGLLSLFKSLLPNMSDHPRVEHLACADVIGAVSPVARERIKRFVSYYGREDIAERVRLIEHPISPAMRYQGELKERRICAVGRWTKADFIKQPDLLLKALQHALAMAEDYEVSIIGDYDIYFREKLNLFPDAVNSRIQLHGRLTTDETAAILNCSQISLCTSVSESFHIASAEALCCGCSVVSYKSPYLPSFEYFITDDSGTLANDGSAASLGGSLVDEMGKWDQGGRDPQSISDLWSRRLHAERVAESILGCIKP